MLRLPAVLSAVCLHQKVLLADCHPADPRCRYKVSSSPCAVIAGLEIWKHDYSVTDVTKNFQGA